MTDRLLQGKVALITGAYRNLGATTAEVLASHGACVVINDVLSPDQDSNAKQVLDRIRASGVEGEAIGADLRQSEQVGRMCRQALERFGRVDILVNNAGPFTMQPYLKMSEETWDTVMDVNLKSVYLTTRELAPQMKKNGWGRIINMCAGSAFVRNHSAYTLAKAGVLIITESLALELGPEITVNAIAPGQIVESLPIIAEFDPTFGERYTARTPARRLVSRREVADVIALLCTDAFNMLNGVTLRLDGGAEIHRF